MRALVVLPMLIHTTPRYLEKRIVVYARTAPLLLCLRVGDGFIYTKCL